MEFPLEKLTDKNRYYRRVLATTAYQQLVLMSVATEIPRETHPYNDQFIRIERGSAEVEADGRVFNLREGDSITIPAGTLHKVTNVGIAPVKLYTIYSPPMHPADEVQRDPDE